MSYYKDRAIIVLSGKIANLSELKKLAATQPVYACDGGARFCAKVKVVPSCIVGDLESISSALLRHFISQKVLIHKFSRDKDFSDFELAVKLAWQKGCRKFTIFGFEGGRFDHELVNIMLSCNREYTKGRFYYCGLKTDIYRLVRRSSISFEASSNSTVSLIPVSNVVKGVRTKGLKWKLDSEDLYLGKTRSLSNEVKRSIARNQKTRVSVSIKDGICLVLRVR